MFSFSPLQCCLVLFTGYYPCNRVLTMKKVISESEHIDTHGIDFIIGAWHMALLTIIKYAIPVKKQSLYMPELFP